MKKVLALLMAGLLLLPCFGFAVSADESGLLEVEADGVLLQFEAAPFIENDRTLVPVRALCTALGIADEDITFTDGAVAIAGTVDGKEISVSFAIGSSEAMVNGKPIGLDVPAKIVNDCTFVPLRFLSELFGCSVLFYPATPAYGNRSLVSIKTPAYLFVTVYMSPAAYEAGVGQLMSVAGAISGIHQVNPIQGVNDTMTDQMSAEQIQLMFAAGEPVIILDDGFVTDEALHTFSAAGTVARLDDAIEKYSPDTLRLIQENEEVKKLVTDAEGNIIAFPVERDGKTERLFVSSALAADKAVSLIHAYNEVLKSLTEAGEAPSEQGGEEK